MKLKLASAEIEREISEKLDWLIATIKKDDKKKKKDQK